MSNLFLSAKILAGINFMHTLPYFNRTSLQLCRDKTYIILLWKEKKSGFSHGLNRNNCFRPFMSIFGNADFSSALCLKSRALRGLRAMQVHIDFSNVDHPRHNQVIVMEIRDPFTDIVRVEWTGWGLLESSTKKNKDVSSTHNGRMGSIELFICPRGSPFPNLK